MNDIVVLGASAAVIALMVGVAALFGFRARARIERTELERLLALTEPGARMEEVAIASDGAAALARLAGGRLLVAKVMGADVSVRVYPAAMVRVAIEASCVRASVPDMGFPVMKLALGGPSPGWLREFAGA